MNNLGQYIWTVQDKLGEGWRMKQKNRWEIDPWMVAALNLYCLPVFIPNAGSLLPVYFSHLCSYQMPAASYLCTSYLCSYQMPAASNRALYFVWYASANSCKNLCCDVHPGWCGDWFYVNAWTMWTHDYAWFMWTHDYAWFMCTHDYAWFM